MKTINQMRGFRKFRSLAVMSGALAIMTIATGCRKDDDGPSGPKLSPVTEAANTTVTAIADAVYSGGGHSPVTTESTITFAASGTIKDISKMVLEMNVAHTWGQDISFALQSPDGTRRDFIYRAGGQGNYIAANLYRFNSTFTGTIPFGGNIDFPAGDYKESKGDYPAITLEPIFSSFSGKQINGTWKLLITDHESQIVGSLKSWKLHFAEGALQQ